MDHGKRVYYQWPSTRHANIAQPMLWSMYFLNYLDRNAIALARLNSLEEDLKLTGTRE